MPWYDLLENTEALTRFYTAPPSLNPIHIEEIEIFNDQLWIQCDTEEYPDLAPMYWPTKTTTLNLKIDFYDLRAIRLNGIRAGIKGTLALHRVESNGLGFSFSSKSLEFAGECKFAHINSISPPKTQKPRVELLYNNNGLLATLTNVTGEQPFLQANFLPTLLFEEVREWFDRSRALLEKHDRDGFLTIWSKLLDAGLRIEHADGMRVYKPQMMRIDSGYARWRP